MVEFPIFVHYNYSFPSNFAGSGKDCFIIYYAFRLNSSQFLVMIKKFFFIPISIHSLFNIMAVLIESRLVV